MKRAFLIFLTSAIGFADYLANLTQARAAMNRGDLANAEQILSAAIDEATSKFGRTSYKIDQPLELLVQVYQRQKRDADVAIVHQRRLDIWTKVAGENSVVVARVLQQLSYAERAAGNLPDAESHSRRALAIMTAAYTDKPPSAQAAVDLADILMAQKKNDEAEHLLALAEKGFETSVNPASFLVTGIASRRAALLRQLGRADDPGRIAKSPTFTVYNVGGTGQNQVAAPRILSKIEPQYSEAARKHKLQGTILLGLVVDATGTPTQITVLRPLGMGLDEKAVEAISQWKFSPAQKNGEPVPVFSQIEVTFNLL